MLLVYDLPRYIIVTKPIETKDYRSIVAKYVINPGLHQLMNYTTDEKELSVVNSICFSTNDLHFNLYIDVNVYLEELRKGNIVSLGQSLLHLGKDTAMYQLLFLLNINWS